VLPDDEGRQRSSVESGEASCAQPSNVTPADRQRVLVVEMKADYVGGPVRPVERWVA
jgi:hypothetical protein